MQACLWIPSMVAIAHNIFEMKLNEETDGYQGILKKPINDYICEITTGDS